MTRFIRASETPTATGVKRIWASVRAAATAASGIASASHLRTISTISLVSAGSAIIAAARDSWPIGARTCASPTIAPNSRASSDAALIDGDRLERDLPARRRNLDARTRHRDNFVGIGALIGIEDPPQLGHHSQILGRKDQRHLRHLLDSNPMLTAQAAAHFDARLQDVATRLDRAIGLVGVTLVVKHNRMDIAVARMKHVADSHIVAAADADNRTQNIGQPRARNHAVLRRIIRREPSDRAKR